MPGTSWPGPVTMPSAPGEGTPASSGKSAGMSLDWGAAEPLPVLMVQGLAAKTHMTLRVGSDRSSSCCV